LKLAETLPSMPFERRLKARPDDRHIIGAVGRQRTIAPVPAHPNGSHERAAAVLAAAARAVAVLAAAARAVAVLAAAVLAAAVLAAAVLAAAARAVAVLAVAVLAVAVLAAAGQQQRVGSGWGRFGERILRVRVRAG